MAIPDDFGATQEEAWAILVDAGFLEFDRGHFAAILASHQDDEVVVRLSREMDGWFRYAVAIGGGLVETAHAPRIHDLRLLDEGYVAVEERLRRPENDRECRDVEISQSICAGMTDQLPSGALRGFRGRHPKFQGFVADVASALGRSYLDPTSGNVLLRQDGTLVVNDPCGRTYGPEIRETIEHFRSTPAQHFRP